MAKTTKDIFGGGYTTHGDNGITYKTTKNVLDDGYTTQGSDGSTYKTHKNLLNDGYTTSKISGPSKRSASSKGAEGGIGNSILLFAFTVFILLICVSLLHVKTYIFIAGVLIVPKLSNLCERYRISRTWCSGALFCYAAFGLINSFFADVEVVAGTKRGGEGLIALIVLAMILLVGIMFAIFELGEDVIGFLIFFVLLISIAWCYFDGFASISSTERMKHYALGIILLLSAVDQVILILRR